MSVTSGPNICVIKFPEEEREHTRDRNKMFLKK